MRNTPCPPTTYRAGFWKRVGVILTSIPNYMGFRNWPEAAKNAYVGDLARWFHKRQRETPRLTNPTTATDLAKVHKIWERHGWLARDQVNALAMAWNACMTHHAISGNANLRRATWFALWPDDMNDVALMKRNNL